MLKPGGVFAASDWLSGEQAESDPAFAAFLEHTRLRFAMATASQTARVMRQAGFVEVTTVDRNAWYAAISAQEVTAIEGPLRDEIIEASSAAVYDDWLATRRRLAGATKSGGLRPTHLRGRRPS